MALQLPSENPFAASMGLSLPAMYARVARVTINVGAPAMASVIIYADKAARDENRRLSATDVAFDHDQTQSAPVAQAYAALKKRDEFAGCVDA